MARTLPRLLVPCRCDCGCLHRLGITDHPCRGKRLVRVAPRRIGVHRKPPDLMPDEAINADDGNPRAFQHGRYLPPEGVEIGAIGHATRAPISAERLARFVGELVFDTPRLQLGVQRTSYSRREAPHIDSYWLRIDNPYSTDASLRLLVF